MTCMFYTTHMANPIQFGELSDYNKHIGPNSVKRRMLKAAIKFLERENIKNHLLTGESKSLFIVLRKSSALQSITYDSNVPLAVIQLKTLKPDFIGYICVIHNVRLDTNNNLWVIVSFMYLKSEGYLRTLDNLISTVNQSYAPLRICLGSIHDI